MHKFFIALKEICDDKDGELNSKLCVGVGFFFTWLLVVLPCAIFIDAFPEYIFWGTLGSCLSAFGISEISRTEMPDGTRKMKLKNEIKHEA